MTTKTMKAVVIRKPGAPEVLAIEEQPVPRPALGWVLIRVKAFGLNRSELFTRQGHSPRVKFPRVLGIEAVGIVEEAPGGDFESGQTVATAVYEKSFDRRRPPGSGCIRPRYLELGQSQIAPAWLEVKHLPRQVAIRQLRKP